MTKTATLPARNGVAHKPRPSVAATRDEAMAVLGAYYDMQKLRMGARNKESAHQRRADALADPEFITELKNDLQVIEDKASAGLQRYAESQPLGQWCMSIAGIGGTLAAGLITLIDLQRCECAGYKSYRADDTPIPDHDCPGLTTAGHIWSFAGLTEKAKQWGKGQKRPFCAQLRKICWNIGDQWSRLSVFDKSDLTLAEAIKDAAAKKGQELSDDELVELVEAKKARRGKRAERLDGPAYLYVRLYMQRKLVYVERNEHGGFSEMAAKRLALAKEKHFKLSKDQRELLEAGRVQPSGVDLMARWYAVKIFLSHFHAVGREMLGFPPVKPWVIAHGGHQDYIAPPNWPTK